MDAPTSDAGAPPAEAGPGAVPLGAVRESRFLSRAAGAALLALLVLTAAAFGPSSAPASLPAPPASLPSDDGFRFHTPESSKGTVSPERVEEVRAHLRERRSRIHAFLGVGGTDEPLIDVYLYPSVEAKALATGDMSRAHALPDQAELHLSLQPGLEGTPLAVEALVSAHRHLGPAAHQVLEQGLVARLSDGWLGASPRHWTGRLHRAGLVPPLEELLADEAVRAGSPLAMPAVGATLLEWILEERDVEPGSERFRELYRGWSPGPEELPALEASWTRHLDRLAAAPGPEADPNAPLPPPTGFRRGFNFAHEGYRIHDGYGSAQAEEALERLAELGTNAVAVLPYSSIRDPSVPGPIRISSRTGSENDEAVIHSALEARSLGMAVLLKPHLWVRGSWTGEIRMSSEEDWDRFFREYARWIGHYALLAEAYRLESLCLGVELSAATLERPERWRDLARRIREIYSGELGYCANWGEEAESLAFWDALDFIGVSSYYPLSSKASPSDRELRAEAERVLDRLEALGARHDRPVLLTEAGFASSPVPWQRPWEEERGPGARVDLEAQARGYRALVRALDGRDGIHGIYWWKWPTTGPSAPRDHSGFTPAGKPAEGVVAEWFGGFEGS